MPTLYSVSAFLGKKRAGQGFSGALKPRLGPTEGRIRQITISGNHSRENPNVAIRLTPWICRLSSFQACTQQLLRSISPMLLSIGARKLQQDRSPVKVFQKLYRNIVNIVAERLTNSALVYINYRAREWTSRVWLLVAAVAPEKEPHVEGF